MAANNKKYFWNIVIIVAVTAIAMYFALKDNFKDIVDTIAKMNIFSLLFILAWGMIINVVIGVGYKLLGSVYKKGYSLKEGVIVAFVGTFFAGITPSSTGGQFGQAYVLKRQGISYSDGASLLWADFVIYQTTLMIYVTILFAARFGHYVNLNGWIWIVAAGYVVNVVVIVALYTVALFPNFYTRLCEKVFHYLGKIKWFRGLEKKAENWVRQVSSFTQQTKVLSQNKQLIVGMLLVNFARLTLYFSLPFVVAMILGLKLHPSQFFDSLALASFVVMANSFVPLPGATGGTEMFFTMLFQYMFGRLTGAVLLLWRLSSYYIPVIGGAIIFTLFKNHEDSLEQKAAHRKLTSLTQESSFPTTSLPTNPLREEQPKTNDSISRSS